MTSRIKEVFSKIKAEKRKALITYIVSGDPDTETTIEIMNSMVRQGTDIIESVSYTHLTLPTILLV